MLEIVPHDPVAPFQPSVLVRCRGKVDAEQEVDVRVGRHRGELFARRPHVPRARAAPPEHRLHALDRRQPPVVAQDGPQLRLHPSLDHVAVALSPTAASGAINGLHGYLFRKGI